MNDKTKLREFFAAYGLTQFQLSRYYEVLGIRPSAPIEEMPEGL